MVWEKSYSLWDGNTKIGDIYEKDQGPDTASLKNQEALLKKWLGEDEEGLKREAERMKKQEKEERIKNALASMTEQEKIEYEQILAKLKSDKKVLKIQHKEQKELSKQKEAKEKRFNTFVLILLYIPLIWLSFKILSTGISIGNIIFLAIVLAVGIFLIELVREFISYLYYCFSGSTVDEIEIKIDAIDDKIHNLPLKFEKNHSLNNDDYDDEEDDDDDYDYYDDIEEDE